MANGQSIEGIPLPAGVAHLRQLLGDTPCTQLLVGVEVENNADNLRFPFIDGQNAVLFVVAVELIIAQHMTVFDGLPETEFQSL